MLNCYETIQQEISDQHIELEETSLFYPLNALYARSGDCAVIIVEKDKTSIEKRCLCAEELGHHHTSSGNLMHVCAREYERQERRARKWAYMHILPLDDIGFEFFRCNGNPYDMADNLEVTKEYLDEAIRYYEERHGAQCNTGNYLFKFIPYLKIKKLKDL